MATNPITVDELVALAAPLSALEKVRLAERVLASAEAALTPADLPLIRSLDGLCADLGPGPSEEDIAEARREMWGRVGEGADY